MHTRPLTSYAGEISSWYVHTCSLAVRAPMLLPCPQPVNSFFHVSDSQAPPSLTGQGETVAVANSLDPSFFTSIISGTQIRLRCMCCKAHPPPPPGPNSLLHNKRAGHHLAYCCFLLAFPAPASAADGLSPTLCSAPTSSLAQTRMPRFINHQGCHFPRSMISSSSIGAGRLSWSITDVCVEPVLSFSSESGDSLISMHVRISTPFARTSADRPRVGRTGAKMLGKWTPLSYN